VYEEAVDEMELIGEVHRTAFDRVQMDIYFRREVERKKRWIGLSVSKMGSSEVEQKLTEIVNVHHREQVTEIVNLHHRYDL